MFTAYQIMSLSLLFNLHYSADLYYNSVIVSIVKNQNNIFGVMKEDIAGKFSIASIKHQN